MEYKVRFIAGDEFPQQRDPCRSGGTRLGSVTGKRRLDQVRAVKQAQNCALRLFNIRNYK